MKVFKYSNFDELFLKFNQEILLHPDMLDYSTGSLGYMDNVVIACKTWDCDLDLGNFGYKKNKWGHLLKTYIDYEKLIKFRESLDKATGLSLTFNFNQKQVNNGSCLIAIVLTRKDRKKPWTKCNVLYRTTETQRRMAADLCLVHHFIKELPECCEIERVVFYLTQCYTHANFINGYFDYFGVGYDELDKNHPWTRALLGAKVANYMPDSRITTYQSMARMQKMYRGITKFEPIPCNTLGINNFFEGKKNVNKKI